MIALITGASSGMGRDMAKYLASKGWDLIVVARRKNLLIDLKKQLNVNVKVIELDLIKEENVYKLYNMVKKDKVDLLINNAGFGLFGKFWETSLERELEMINLNIKTVHILTKLFLQDFIQRDEGFILNVCSSAGFLAGPNLSTYYATKNYTTKLTMAIHEELKHKKSHVTVAAFCPGPVNTEFTKVAKGNFTVGQLESSKASKYAIDQLFRKKLIIVPSIKMKLGLFLSRFVPWSLLLKMTYQIQYRKCK